ncbi:MAG TPA: winged helix-turn-helix transcriptional regulator [Solirubrobacterales bacterium]|nr:winged helix-turn-helix transcriptional regulator [Solirubrobacterales bacterium]
MTTTGLSGIEAQPSESEDACVAGASTAEVLRLLSAGATGAILMALGEGPLRTKTLTEQVPGYTPRTIYRYAGKLAELDVIDREEEPGVPSKVVHVLSDPCGTELYTLVNRFADASMTRLPDGRIDAHAWAALGLLADLWEAGIVEELSCEARSPTDLARGQHGLSYHQVNRRAGLFKTNGLVCESEGVGRRRLYGLTDKTRRKMGLIAGIARWRNHHVVAEDEEGMTTAEMATVLRVALPLVKLTGHKGKGLRLSVRSEDEAAGAEGEEIWAEVAGDGTVQSCANPPAEPSGWGRGKVASWIPVILDGEAQNVLVGEDESLVADCLANLYETLWTPQPF